MWSGYQNAWSWSSTQDRDCKNLAWTWRAHQRALCYMDIIIALRGKNNKKSLLNLQLESNARVMDSLGFTDTIFCVGSMVSCHSPCEHQIKQKHWIGEAGKCLNAVRACTVNGKFTILTKTSVCNQRSAWPKTRSDKIQPSDELIYVTQHPWTMESCEGWVINWK